MAALKESPEETRRLEMEGEYLCMGADSPLYTRMAFKVYRYGSAFALWLAEST